MLSPFRSSASFLSGTPVDRDDVFVSPNSSPSNSSGEEEEKEKSIFSPTDNCSHQQRQRRRSSTNRYGSASEVVMSRNSVSSRGRTYSMATMNNNMSHHRTTGTRVNRSGFLVMVLLLLLILIATIRIPVKDEVLDTYLNAASLRQLWKIPLMRGWHIEIIAVHQ